MLPATAPTADLHAAQLRRVRALLAAILPGNAFYARKLAGCDLTLGSFDDLANLPFTTKAELTADQSAHPPYGTNLTFEIERYSRLHQTSGTSTGQPLRWLDTPDSWEWMLGCWRAYFALMGLKPGDRLFFPFSFGPFLGFWSAFDAATRSGFFCVPGGGMSTEARLKCLLEHRCTVLFATPTYALHLGEVALKEGIDTAGSCVRAVVVAGEPGGNIAATRQRIEAVWGARCFDHYGMTEIGPVAVEADDGPGHMYLLEREYHAEVVDPATGAAVPDGTAGELVLTNLGRTGSPLIRYRTGDLVRLAAGVDPWGRVWRRLEGGILGRADDMIHVRGNNLYPSAIEAIVRRFPEVAEYRLYVEQRNALTDLRLEVEPTTGDGLALADAIGRAVRAELLFRVEVTAAPPGSLPRFELKARRVVRNEK
ncbi:phenylacetate--CoA ligase family protein [Frigoriglobus tundricola]|uniref:Coenzyme A ligase n=1 Tax=Frigoriglobus tundricola TaxID=2774151 RepID=A0A6M5Z1W1_9BACT|nr:AMP-binding protein [Frigoriglobus tundricola]QJX00380.1 Coenzyme A ligase [Frigoriglobus tundricola]